MIPIGAQSIDPNCNVAEKDTLYVQYACQVPPEDLKVKRKEALLAGCAAVFACLVLLAVLKYRIDSIAIEKKSWDLSTVTASDYTLEIDLEYEQI
jgi:hypothetical protein